MDQIHTIIRYYISFDSNNVGLLRRFSRSAAGVSKRVNRNLSETLMIKNDVISLIPIVAYDAE